MIILRPRCLYGSIKGHKLGVRLYELNEDYNLIIENGSIKLSQWGSLIKSGVRFFLLGGQNKTKKKTSKKRDSSTLKLTCVKWISNWSSVSYLTF